MTRRPPRIPGTPARRTLYVLPSIPDNLDPATKNALAIRNACATEGRCPCCKAAGEIHADPELDGVYHYLFRHEDWCEVLRDEDVA